MFFIQECDKHKILFKIFNYVKLYEDKLIIPEIQNTDLKKINKVVKKIKRILNNQNDNQVYISKNLKNNKVFIEKLKAKGITILNGRKLFVILTDKILDYILKKKNLKKENTTISILVNNLENDYIIEHITKIINEYKNVNIVTENIGKFKQISEKFEGEGIIINITNNKKKALLRSNIILNVDFKTEQLNKYNIPDDAIIVNEKENVKINKKRFNGICINNYEISYYNIDMFDYDKECFYDKKDVYEAQFINKKIPYTYIKNKIIRDNVEILFLKGNNNVY